MKKNGGNLKKIQKKKKNCTYVYSLYPVPKGDLKGKREILEVFLQ